MRYGSPSSMTARALFLVLASAFVHAAWNAILKRCRNTEHAVLAGSAVSSIFAVLVALPFGFEMGAGDAWVWCLVAGLLEAAYFQTLGRALGRGTLGLVYTVSRGGALLVVWPVSILLLGEPLTGLRALGTLLVLAGLAATGFTAPAPAGSSEGRASSRAVSSAFALAALTGLFIGGYNLAYKKALGGGVAPSTANAISLGLAGSINFVAIGAGRRRGAWAALREQPLPIALAGFLGATGFLLFLAALAHVGAGMVVTLRNTSILFAQALGFLLGERPSRVALMGTGAVAVGAVLLSL